VLIVERHEELSTNHTLAEGFNHGSS
jgi:hypothetical protein